MGIKFENRSGELNRVAFSYDAAVADGSVTLDDLLILTNGVFDYIEIPRGKLKKGEVRGSKGVVNHVLASFNGDAYRNALPSDPEAEIKKVAKKMAGTGAFKEDEALEILRAKVASKS